MLRSGLRPPQQKEFQIQKFSGQNKLSSKKERRLFFLTGLSKRENFVKLWQLKNKIIKTLSQEQAIDRIRFRYEADIGLSETLK